MPDINRYILGKNIPPSLSAHKRALLTGWVILSAVLVCLYYIGLNLKRPTSYVLTYYYGFLIILILAFLLNWVGKHTLAKFILMISGNAIIFVFAADEPPIPGTFLFFIVPCLGAFTMFGYEERWRAVFFTSLTFALFLVAKYTTFSLLPSYDFKQELVDQNFFNNFTIVYLLTTLILFFLININHRFEEKLLKSQEELTRQNELLTSTNTELIKTNTELNQFSFTVSHNLRGPIASLLGLVNLLNQQNSKVGLHELIPHIKSSAERLDQIVGDLHKIIDIRNGLFKVRQLINWQTKLEVIKQILREDLVHSQAIFEEDFSKCPEVYSVAPMIHSILYNLLSNAIKFHAPDRPLHISITTFKTATHYFLRIRDNGLGIDVEANHEHIFKLYKRFHYHMEGKGIGLYLVKLQCELLGGSIHVSSELNKYTEFLFSVAIPPSLDHQIIESQPFADVIYDARINAMGIIWKNRPSSSEYRSIYRQALTLLQEYGTQNWIVDPTHQGLVTPEDARWLADVIMPKAIALGLKRSASILPESNEPAVLEYHQKNKIAMESYGVHVEFFKDFETCKRWIAKGNELEKAKNE
jgi:signal transduction histidine kinase